MRCLHCGKRLSLLRKFSDGEFCSAEHRSLFDRLNNDLGLQRLIASQSTREKAKPAPPRAVAGESQPAGQAPPLGNLVQGPQAIPIVVRLVSQPAATPLLGPKAAEVPQAQLRSSIRGLCERGDLLSAPLPGAPMGAGAPQATQTPKPLEAVRAGAGAGPTREAAASSNEPRLQEDLRELTAGTAVRRARECHLTQVEQEWGVGHSAAPALVLGMIPPGSEERRTTEKGRDPQEKGLDSLAGLCGLDGLTPVQAHGWRTWPDERAGLFDPAGPASPRGGAWPAAAALGLTLPVGLATRSLDRVHETRLVTPGIAGARGESAKPRLRFKTERVEHRETVPVDVAMDLKALALMVCGAASTTVPAVIEAKPAPVGLEISLVVGRSGQPVERGFDMGEMEGIVPQWAETLRPWREPVTAPLRSEAAEASVPSLELRPEVPSGGEALAQEILAQEILEGEELAAAEAAAVETVAEAAEEEKEQAPPLHDQQRRLMVQRPMTRAQSAPRGPEAGIGAVWRMALEAETRCPRLKMKPDHADGSGSRSNRADLRSRGAMDRFKSVQERIPGGRFWRSAPADLKWIGLALPLILGLVVWSFRGSVAPVEASLPQQPDASKTVIAKQVHKFQQVLLSRAAIRLFDDFRGGLGAWNGKSTEWAKSWKYTDAGFLEPGELAIYEPTQEMQDYTMEFLGQIERRSLNWAFRAKDLNNYYAMRIVITRGGPLPSASLVRYAVINGKETSHKTLPLPLALRPDTVYRVRMDVRGTQFTTSMQGQVVDTFEDNRLPEGGVGFWSPRGDQSLLRWVEVMHQYDYLGRLCALLAPYPLQGGGQQAD